MLKIDDVSVRNIADRAPLVPGTDINDGLTLFDTDASGAFNGQYQVGAYDSSTPDAYTFSETGIDYTQAKQWAYRGTFYLPEHLVTAETQGSQTQMLIAATLYTAQGVSRAAPRWSTSSSWATPKDRTAQRTKSANCPGAACTTSPAASPAWATR